MSDAERLFEDFVRRRGTALLRTAYLISGDRHRAEDLTQTALAATYARLHQLRDVDSLDAYVRRAIVTAHASWWRRLSSHELPADELPEGRYGDCADHLVERAVVLAALHQLPPRQRAAVVLRYYDDASEADVARALGCSVGSVKTHTSRGMARLRELLAPPREPGRVGVARDVVA